MHVCKPKQTLPFPLQYKLANAWRPVYLLISLVAQSEIQTADPGRLQYGSDDKAIDSFWSLFVLLSTIVCILECYKYS